MVKSTAFNIVKKIADNEIKTSSITIAPIRIIAHKPCCLHFILLGIVCSYSY